jgi:hypothetical protein
MGEMAAQIPVKDNPELNEQAFNMELFQQLKEEELEKMKREVGEEAFTNGRFKEAIKL